jgi:hypothetical protein
MSCFTQRSLEGAGTPRTTAYPAGNYYLPPSPHLGREPMAPGWIRLPRGRGHDDRVWFIFTDPQPTEKMGATRHCRQLRPQTPALCWRGQGPSPLLQAGQCPHPPEIATLATNTTSALYFDRGSALSTHTQCSDIDSHRVHIRRNLVTQKMMRSRKSFPMEMTPTIFWLVSLYSSFSPALFIGCRIWALSP